MYSICCMFIHPERKIPPLSLHLKLLCVNFFPIGLKDRVCTTFIWYKFHYRFRLLTYLIGYRIKKQQQHRFQIRAGPKYSTTSLVSEFRCTFLDMDFLLTINKDELHCNCFIPFFNQTTLGLQTCMKHTKSLENVFLFSKT